MTEAEWLACADPEPMLKFLRGKASDRKLRLFAVACCRRVWKELDFHRRTAVEVAERYADSQSPFDELEEACEAAWDVVDELERIGGDEEDWLEEVEYAGVYAVAQLTCVESNDCSYLYRAVDTARSVADLARSAKLAAERSQEARRSEGAEQSKHAKLLRDIFGNPFGPLPHLPPAVFAWNDRTVPRLAQAIYEDRKMLDGTLDPGRLAILADALLDAGCDDEELLAHCRSEGPHVRGCWAVDLILGKS